MNLEQPNNESNFGKPSEAARGNAAEREYGPERFTLETARENYERFCAKVTLLDTKLNEVIEESIKPENKDMREVNLERSRIFATELAKARAELEKSIQDAVAYGGKKEDFPMIPTTH